jgi:probable H4MPT-linked C1 transfer pathway protein
MVTKSILGLDIGGANLKAAHSDGTALSQRFELWKQPNQLAGALANLCSQLPAFDVLAVTMTGELCDCFESRRHGVQAILDAVDAVAGGRKVLVWRTDGQFADSVVARQAPELTAAANWMALATYGGRLVPHGPALLVDTGTTTTDVVPLNDGVPVPRGKTDRDRLRCQELVYTGCQRTPVCALLGSSVAAEFFATTRDVYLLLGELPESGDCATADGRPATRAGAHARLARMLGGDGETCPLEATLALARKAALVQQLMIEQAVRRVGSSLSARPACVVISGCGEFLARRALAREGFGEECLLSLSSQLGIQASTAACAYALVVLAGERPFN